MVNDFRVHTSWECRISMAFSGLFPGPKINFKGHRTTLGPSKGKTFFVARAKKLPKFYKKIIRSPIFQDFSRASVQIPGFSSAWIFIFKFQGFPEFSRAVRTLWFTHYGKWVRFLIKLDYPQAKFCCHI